jgi:hypothetical protein
MLNVICLKHGTKYGPEYVNNLYNMITRHLTVPFNFVCFTDNPIGLNPGVGIIKLPDELKLTGWWWKPYIFKKEHFVSGDINLFFDLDMVIVKNIDKLINYMPDQFIGLRDVGRVFNRGRDKLGSAVLRWPAGKYSEIWETLANNPALAKQFHGDQDYIWHTHKTQITFYPDSWIRSYKWEVRNKADLIRVNGRFNFKDIQNPTLETETCVLAFHGTPDPHEVKDSIIVDNWR